MIAITDRGDKFYEECALVSISEVLFARELSDPLIGLEMTSQGSRKERLLASVTIGKIKNMKEYLRSEKSGTTRKTYATALMDDSLLFEILVYFFLWVFLTC
jgi:hypothetical protein